MANHRPEPGTALCASANCPLRSTIFPPNVRISGRSLRERKVAALACAISSGTWGENVAPDAVQFIRGRFSDEARSCSLLRAGTTAALYELSDRAAFFAPDRSRHLRRMAEGYSAARQRLTLSAVSYTHLTLPPNREEY